MSDGKGGAGGPGGLGPPSARIALFVFLGYFCGNIDFVKRHFSIIVLAIIVLSVMPIVYEIYRARRERKSEAASDSSASRAVGSP